MPCKPATCSVEWGGCHCYCCGAQVASPPPQSRQLIALLLCTAMKKSVPPDGQDAGRASACGRRGSGSSRPLAAGVARSVLKTSIREGGPSLSGLDPFPGRVAEARRFEMSRPDLYADRRGTSTCAQTVTSKTQSRCFLLVAEVSWCLWGIEGTQKDWGESCSHFSMCTSRPRAAVVLVLSGLFQSDPRREPRDHVGSLAGFLRAPAGRQGVDFQHIAQPPSSTWPGPLSTFRSGKLSPDP